MIREVNLQSYLPLFMREYQEIAATLDAEDPEFRLVWNAANRVLYNEFIATADEYGISRFEKILGILPSKDETLEFRRRRVMIRWNFKIPYTLKFLQEILNELYGENMIIIHVNDKYELWFDIDNRVILRMNELRSVVDSIVPVNLLIKVQQRMLSDVFTYVGGKISCLRKIGIQTNTEFNLPSFGINSHVGGKVTVVNIISFETRNV